MRLYNDLAYLWPVVSPPEEYIVEAAEWLDVIRSRLAVAERGNRRPTLLELGCGGGHLLSHLTRHFTTEAVDISERMLEISQRLNADTAHHLGDMRTVRLGRAFDVVIIHDAINYMLTETDLRAAIATATAHLNPGGVALLAPDWLQETFSGPRLADWTRRDADLNVAFIEYVAQAEPGAIESVFVFIVNREGRIEVEIDRHTGGLFPKSVWLDLMAAAGLDAEYMQTEGYEGGFGGNLFVGTLRKAPGVPGLT